MGILCLLNKYKYKQIYGLLHREINPNRLPKYLRAILKPGKCHYQSVAPVTPRSIKVDDHNVISAEVTPYVKNLNYSVARQPSEIIGQNNSFYKWRQNGTNAHSIYRTWKTDKSLRTRIIINAEDSLLCNFVKIMPI